MHLLAVPRSFILSRPEHRLPSETVEQFRSAAARRLAGEPLQYITGRQEFYGLPFAVAPGVLIPRPETEHLIEAVLTRAGKDEPLRIADVGTGSGAIAVTLAHLLENVTVTATDISPAALAVARANAESIGVSGRIAFVETDLLAGVAGDFDFVVSNPPYVSLADRASLAVEVREHEPAVALFAGETGLEIYRRLIPQAAQALKSGGWLLMEIGYGQQRAMEELLTGWNQVGFVADLQGIPRVACAQRP